MRITFQRRKDRIRDHLGVRISGPDQSWNQSWARLEDAVTRSSRVIIAPATADILLYRCPGQYQHRWLRAAIRLKVSTLGRSLRFPPGEDIIVGQGTWFHPPRVP